MNKKLLITSSAAALLLGTSFFLAAAKGPVPTPATVGNRIDLSIAPIYWEYNSSANDLGVHVTLDGEDWKTMKIFRPDDVLLFDVRGKGPYQQLGMTELFFEGAEPSLDTYPLNSLLTKFPQGEYEFEGLTVDNDDIEGESDLSHAIPSGPRIAAIQGPNHLLRIQWQAVTGNPLGFPVIPFQISGYQVIVGKFQVTVPAGVTSVTVSREYVQSLPSGVYDYEVLAIATNGNQTITEGTFVR